MVAYYEKCIEHIKAEKQDITERYLARVFGVTQREYIKDIQHCDYMLAMYRKRLKEEKLMVEATA